MDEASVYVNSVLNAMKIINLFATENTSLGVTDVSRKLGIHKATVFKIMRTLKKENWLMQDSRTSCYYLGIGMVPIALAIEKSFKPHDAFLRMMQELKNQIWEDVVLCEVVGKEALCVLKIESDHILVTSAREGEALPLHIGATGKSLLAFQSRELITEVYNTYREELSQGEDAFFDELERIRQQEYAVTCGDYDEGVNAVGVPVFGKDGIARYSLSVAGPTDRLEAVGLVRIRLMLQETARQMESLLNTETERTRKN